MEKNKLILIEYKFYCSFFSVKLNPDPAILGIRILFIVLPEKWALNVLARFLNWLVIFF